MKKPTKEQLTTLLEWMRGYVDEWLATDPDREVIRVVRSIVKKLDLRLETALKDK